MSHPFDQLTPDLVLDAVESLGYLSDARVLALNSYENRVYQVGIEDGEPLIAKFYRPDRWSDAAIREEHAFSAELAECEVPVVAPLSRDGESLFAFSGFRFALFPRLLKRLDALFAEVPYQPIRLHGDCHPGNLLCRDEVYHMVDLDDCRMGPALQDLWMMLAGERHERLAQIAELVDGYNEFHDFDPRQLPLLEGLRSLRLMHYSAWLARRWDDPAFPPSFPWFGSERYWGEQVLVLREQLAALDEEPLRLF